VLSLLKLTGQFSVLITTAFSLSISRAKIVHSNITCFTVWSPYLHLRCGLSIILHLYKYDFMLPCPVVIVVCVWCLRMCVWCVVCVCCVCCVFVRCVCGVCGVNGVWCVWSVVCGMW